MAKHVGALQCPAMIGVGAAFDFHSGCVPWAPPFIRRLGLEWVFRLAVDPKRMWRKDVLSALFVVRVLLQGRRHPPSITMLSSS
jgi:N-acetylglucosaminyldiphosphoundecaprenol N-acetyl-beta-D-mannosaminyltransferase